MSVNKEAYFEVKRHCDIKGVTLVAVSKLQSVEDIMALYELGHRDFGENYVQELMAKHEQLPKDIQWHFIGHLQGNKVKYIAPFVHMVHGVDSLRLLKEIDKQAAKNNRVIDCLLQVHIAVEETKFGFDETEVAAAVEEANELVNVNVCGLMGMASFSSNMELVRTEFKQLKKVFDVCFPVLAESYSPLVSGEVGCLSMGMSADYELAIEEGSTIVRVGSLLFGARKPKTN